MKHGRRVAFLAAFVALLPVLFPAAARADGWSTWRRAEQYTSVIARHDTIWCGSLDGGLERFPVATGRFESFQRRSGGLSSVLVTALAFDRSGRLWVGTQDQGISRLSADGARWDVVTQLDGLPAGSINALRALGDTLLIGTDHGLALWTGTEIGGTVPEGVNGSPFESNVVTGLALRVTASDTSLWVGTEKGLYVNRRFPYDTLSRVFDFGPLPITGLGWDGTTLMVVVNGLAYTYQAADGTWAQQSGISVVQGIHDAGGVILVSGDDGVHRWTGSGWASYDGAPASQTCSMGDDPACHGPAVPALDAGGRLWVGNRQGLHEGAGGTWILHEPDAVPGNDIQNLAVHEGRVYVATFSDGVGRYDGATWRVWPAEACRGCDPDTTFLNSHYAFSLMVDREGWKWVGCWGTGLEVFDDAGGFRHPVVSDTVIPLVRHTRGWSSDWDPRGGHWIGMDSPLVDEEPPIGIDYYDSTGAYVANYQPINTPSMPTGQVRALYVDRFRNKLWVGFRGNGVRIYELAGRAPGAPLLAVSAALPAGKTDLNVFGIAGTRDSVWVMSDADLRRFSVSGSTYGQVAGAPVIRLVGAPAPRGACHPLDIAPDGTLWVGTDHGLHAYRGAANAAGYDSTEYTTANSPIAGDEVRAVRVDPATGAVWVGTSRGLSRFDPGWVAPPPAELPSLEVRVWPNPAWQTGAGPGLRLAGNATAFQGRIYDAAGRLLHRFEASSGQVFWNGRDDSGQLVRPGLYFVRVEAGTHARTLRVVLLR